MLKINNFVKSKAEVISTIQELEMPLRFDIDDGTDVFEFPVAVYYYEDTLDQTRKVKSIMIGNDGVEIFNPEPYYEENLKDLIMSSIESELIKDFPHFPAKDFDSLLNEIEKKIDDTLEENNITF